jgi:4-hydroxybenzoate polyprenyltransferase
MPSKPTADAVQPNESIARTLLALVRTSRPLGWIAAVALQRIGMAYAAVEESPVTLGLSVALTFPFCLYLFGLNDLADEVSDRSNPRKGNWIHGASKTVARPAIARIAPWLGGLAVALFVPLLPLRAAALLAAILFLAWAYSSHPLRLKEVPIVDGLVTATIMIGLLCLGYLSGGTTQPIPAEAFAVAPTLAGLHIFASVVDVDSDREAGHRTLAVRLGPRATGAVALVLSLITVATIPFLQYADPIFVYVIVQPCIIAGWMILPRLFTPRRAISIVGLCGLLTLIYFSLVYVRGW